MQQGSEQLWNFLARVKYFCYLWTGYIYTVYLFFIFFPATNIYVNKTFI